MTEFSLRRYFLLIIAAAVLTLAEGCSERAHNEFSVRDREMLSLLTGAVSEGRYPDVVSLADSLIALPDDSVSFTVRKAARGCKALAYIMSNNLDSAENYILDLEEMIKADTGAYYNIYIGNTAVGIYAIKKEMDYAKALSGFYKALEVSVKKNDTVNQAVSLSNISSVHLLRKDTSGLEYAREAYRLSRKTETPYVIAGSAINLSNMLLLAGKYADALRYADTAKMWVENVSHQCELELVRARALSATGHAREAERIYRTLEPVVRDSAPDMAVRYGTAYGEFLLSRGDAAEAVDVLESALSGRGLSHEDMSTLYLLLSEASASAGNDGQSLKYYKMYHAYCDSLAVYEKELQLNNMMRRYNQVKYEKDIAAKELAVVKANRNTEISVVAALAVGVVALVFGIMYRRTNGLYRKLVEQHQRYIQKEAILTEQNRSATGHSPEEAKDRELFDRLERLMDTEKSYRMKDVSLNKLAEMLSSNRAYVSKVINRFADQTFSSYINSKRINEAIAVLSDPENDTPLKMLSDDLGYNTLSTFYRAFAKETGCPPSKYRSGMRYIRKE